MANTHVMYPLNQVDYDADDAAIFHGTRTNGVYSDATDFLATPNGGMQVAISKGSAWLNYADGRGVAFRLDDTFIVTCGTADGVLNRIDRVVIRRDSITTDGYIALKAGTPASNAVAPNLQRDGDYYEIALADIHVNAGTVQITADLIEDRRLDEDLCGIMRDGVTRIPTAQLQLQAEALLELIRDELSRINDGTEFMLRTDYDLENIVKNAGGIVPYLDSVLVNKASIAKNVFIGSAAAGQTIQIENVRQYDHLRVWITNGTVDGVPIEVCRKTTPAGVLNDVWESGTISPGSDTQTGATVALNTAANGNGLIVTSCSRMNHNAGGPHGSVSSAYVIVRVDAYK